MICRKPFTQGGIAYGCGQCLPCRIKRRRIWTHRLMLESFCHQKSAFVTLTYSDEKLPLVTSSRTSELVATLKPADLRGWLKRYREAIKPLKVRFYGVGEYGDGSLRPHYHVILFGAGECARYRTRRAVGTSKPDPERCCEFCSRIHKTWGHGLIDVGEFNLKTAGYVAEYTVKKMTAHGDGRLDGRHPEFGRMSLRPGIGFGAMYEVADTLLKFGLESREDVPGVLDHGRSKYPLGRYLMATLREMVGKEKGAPQEIIDRLSEELLPLQFVARASEKSLSQLVVEANLQSIRNIETSHEIFRQRKKL